MLHLPLIFFSLPFFRLFDEEELEQLLSGIPEISVADWRQHACFTGFAEGAPIIEWFWQVLESFTQASGSRFVGVGVWVWLCVVWLSCLCCVCE